MTNYSFHKENGTLNDKREKDMLAQIDYIFSIIEGRSNNRKRTHLNMDDNSNNTVSYSIILSIEFILLHCKD